RRRDAEGLEAPLAHEPLELAHARHALEGVDADAGQPDEAIGIALQQRRLLLVGDAEGHRAHDPELAELFDVGVEAHVGAMVGTLAARAEDAAVVRHAVAGRLRRGRLLGVPRLRLARLRARDAAFHVDDSYHHGLLRLFSPRIIASAARPCHGRAAP